MMISKKIVLHFPHALVDQPIVFKLAKDYDMTFNILRARITPEEEGVLVLELRGEESRYKDALEYLGKVGVSVEPLSKDIIRNEKCTDCGVCVPICPTDALVIGPSQRKVMFNNSECIACELCVKVCPVKAMEIHV